MLEYISKQMSIEGYENEIKKLIKAYNKKTDANLIIYTVNTQMSNLPISLDMEDHYTIRDILRNDDSKKLHFYIETTWWFRSGC
jgi:hypothetical protein